MKYSSLAVLLIVLSTTACASTASTAQQREFFDMDARIGQVVAVLQGGGGCAAVERAVQLGLETLYGGLRPLPSADLLEETVAADQKIARNEQLFAGALGEAAGRDDCPEVQARALDLKIFIEQINEVAVAVGRVTVKCGVGRPCDGLEPFLDEMTGHEVRREPIKALEPSFSFKLRSPFVPTNFVSGWEEDLFETEPIAGGECVAIFKETRGLMLKLHLERIDVVRDPWATATLARGTKIPIFSLEWVPSQYGKTWSICNTGKGLETSVSQKVKQDIPLNYFWRYYGKGKWGKGGHH